VTEKAIKDIDKKIRQQVAQAADFAKSPEPDMAETVYRRCWWRSTEMALNSRCPPSPTMEEGTLAKWLVKAGDAVRIWRHLSPKSKPTRRRWNSDPSRRGMIGELLVSEAPKA
jgi:hypothetical protein